MLKAKYLASSGDDVMKIYAQLEHDIIMSMVRRLGKLGEITDYSTWQAKIYKEIGGLQKDISSYLSNYEKEAQKEIQNLFNESMNKAIAEDVKMFNIAKRELADNEKQILQSTFSKIENKDVINKTFARMATKHKDDETFKRIQRLTMTVANTSSDKFIQAANNAFMKVSSGAFTYDDAFKMAVNKLAKDGIDTVEYTDSGRTIHRSIESAVRSNILTGINQNASEITLSNCEDLGTDLVEVSAHMGARPDHAEWQGKVYCLNGEREYIDADGNKQIAKNFYEVCHFGEPTGICGINCRHSYYPYFEGTEKQYSNGELDEMKDNLIKYKDEEGKERTITQYEAEQDLRLCERNIRRYKTQADAFFESGYGDTPEAYQARAKVGEWQARARAITEKTGIQRDYAREYIGTVSGKQPRKVDSEFAILKKAESKEYNTDPKFLANVEKGKEMTVSQADNGSVNPKYGKLKGYSENCQTSVAVFEARLRGWDVEALPYSDGTKMEILARDLRKGWLDASGNHPDYIYMTNANTVDNAIKYVEKTIQTGERYILKGKWKNRGYGHVISVFRDEQGILNYYDPQTNTFMDDFAINDFFAKMRKGKKETTCMNLLRIDNLQINTSLLNYLVKRHYK